MTRRTTIARPTDPQGDARRHAAVAARDAAADGAFVFAVRTTGIYCRPSCPARRAKPGNIAFYSDGAAAKAAGFRPCLRCRPDEESAAGARSQALVAAACRTIAQAETPPTLTQLAAQARLSPHHFHRMFKALTGVTPKGYASAQLRARLHAELESAGTLTEAALASGFNSTGRAYARAPALLGMSLAQSRAKGRGVVLHYATGRCSLGAILVAASEKGVAAILLGDEASALVADLRRRFANADLRPGEAAFAKTLARAIKLVDAPEARHSLPLDLAGTAFQQAVWQALCAIPAGSTATYSEIAARIGKPKAVRAVAAACAANCVAVAVPCHRVVRTDGDLSGYRWGVARKRALLKRERTAR